MRVALVSLVAAGFFIAAAAQTIAQSNQPQPAALADLIRQARERFTPPGDKELAEARAELRRRANELERFVRPTSANGRQWLKYLQWDSFKQQLPAQGQPDLAVLTETYQLLNRNEPGLELTAFRQLSQALRRFRDLSAMARAENPTAVYNRLLDTLAADLERLRTQPAQRSDYDIGRRLEVLTGLGQAPELVAAIRKEFAAPNAFMNVSEGLLRAAAEEPINRRDPVTDNILGTSINGTGHTTGSVVARVVPSDESARIELTSQGHVVSENTGRNGPAVIRSTGHADFTATKQIDLSDKVFRSTPARVDARYRSDIHSISKAGGGIGSRLVSSQGWSRARQNENRINEIASDHTEDRVARRIDDEVSKKLRDARKRYEDQYRRPLARRGDLPEHIQFGSTADELAIQATQANRGQLGAPAGPPELPAGHDMVVRLHQSAINNYSATVLGGATATESEPGQDRSQFDVELPKWMKDAWEKKRTDEAPAAGAANEPFKPWSLTFRQGRPLSADFDDNKITLTIHVARLTSGDEQFTEWDITGTFTPQLEGGSIVLRRQGDLVVLPTGFDTTRGDLNARQVAIRSNLTKVLNERSAQGRGFPSRIEFAQLEPSGSLEKVGPLEARQLTSDNGWLTLAWNRKSTSIEQGAWSTE